MKALRIADMKPEGNYLAFDLQHILDALGERAVHSEWRVRDVWATGDDSAAALESFDGSQTVSGQRLRALAEDVVQVIDGVFTGYDSGSTHQPWVVIEADDSSYYVVRSAEERVLDAIRSSFKEVTPYEQPVT